MLNAWYLSAGEGRGCGGGGGGAANLLPEPHDIACLVALQYSGVRVSATQSKGNYNPLASATPRVRLLQVEHVVADEFEGCTGLGLEEAEGNVSIKSKGKQTCNVIM